MKKQEDQDEILNVSNLCVFYDSVKALDNYSLTLKHGEKIIVAGPNGSGKTTLLKCILGSIKPNAGTVKAYTNNIAYCKQNLPESAFPISAREVVAMGLYRKKDANETEVEKAMEKTNTLSIADRAFYSLSGGERQKVSLARCFCQKADLILLDEPSTFLDKDSLTEFTEILKSLPENISVIVVTHDKDLMEKLNWKTVLLNQGGTNE